MRLSFSQKILLFIFTSITYISANAQQQPNINVQIGINPLDCSSYLLEKKENFDRVRVEARGSGDARIEIYLRRFLEQCSTSSFHQKVEEDLKMILEVRAEHLLSLAKYYLKNFEEKKSVGIKGAEARLKEVTQKYPQYSKRDEVLHLLVKANLYQNETEEARKYYRLMLDEFPFSSYVCETNKLFNQPLLVEKDR